MKSKELEKIFESNFKEITKLEKTYELDSLAYIDSNLMRVNLKELKIILKNARTSIIWYFKDFAKKILEIHKDDKDADFISHIKRECFLTMLDREKQYTNNKDRLSHFKIIGQLLGLTSYQIALIWMSKQWGSLMDYEAGKKFDFEILVEKTKDVLNYLTLIEACFIDDMEKK